MATVIGIFENAYKNKKPLPIVKPGTQSRKFTHISDTVKVCYDAWKKNKCRHYSVSSKKDYSILEVAKLFGSKIKSTTPASLFANNFLLHVFPPSIDLKTPLSSEDL